MGVEVAMGTAAEATAVNGATATGAAVVMGTTVEATVSTGATAIGVEDATGMEVEATVATGAVGTLRRGAAETNGTDSSANFMPRLDAPFLSFLFFLGFSSEPPKAPHMNAAIRAPMAARAPRIRTIVQGK